MTRLTTLDIPTFHRSFVGFDRLFNDMETRFANSSSQGYPPYNVEQVAEDEYLISLAVAGFGMEDIDITHDGDQLRIEGNSPAEKEDVKYLHKGIAGRNFRREFTLADHMTVTDASLKNGMLNISLVREVPEEMKPKKIAISV